MWYKSSSMEEQILIGLTSADGLHYSTLSAGLYGCERLVQLLLERGANPNKASLSGNTPLLRAVWYGRAEVVQILLEHGADPNKGGPHGYGTPLHPVAGSCYTDMVLETVLVRGAQDKNCECTLLHIAADYGLKEIVQLLLARGADPNKRNRWGHTPLKYASTRHKEVAEILRQYGLSGTP